MADRRFQELISQLSTRESSTLVVATVASSASLVLLGIGTGQEPLAHFWAGFLFPVGGEIYRELTIFTIDRSDSLELANLSQKESTFSHSKWSWTRHLRRFAIRLFLLGPSLLWLEPMKSPIAIHPLTSLGLSFLGSYEIDVPVNLLQFAIVVFLFISGVAEFALIDKPRSTTQRGTTHTTLGISG